ncbi:MAG: HAD-IG family 5'-nucleotidase [Myxococcales bacterium]|nr:HAD-IG family 5'-nucleotidase [Myxococcales bacterium]
MLNPPDGSQLALPNVDFESAPGAALQVTTLPRARRVYVNRSLRLDQVEWVGFDMDYTLAIYRQAEMDRLSIEATLKKLVARGYPDLLLEARFDTNFPIRGLVIDKRFGHVVKMDRYKFVGRAWHGLQELPREQRYALYHAKKLKVAPPRYHYIDTLYALPEAALYAGAVDLLDRYGINTDYQQLFDDIRECIDEAHRDGAINDTIALDLPRYVDRDPNLAATLHKLRSAGKKLFVLTNSRWAYTDAMMTYLLGGALPEYTHWRQYFDIVSVAAGKPGFFTERRPFLERVTEGDAQSTRPAYALERGHIYENGNLRDFERMLNVTGDRILYVGDHIFGDILRSKKDSSWRTAMIIQEMDEELAAQEECQEALEQLDSMARRRERLEDELRFYQARYRAATRARAAGEIIDEARLAIENLKLGLRELETASRALKKTTERRFHPYWGSLFKQGVELSSFGDQVEEYACLYTSRVSNLLHYSPLHYFRSSRDLMPHEL